MACHNVSMAKPTLSDINTLFRDLVLPFYEIIRDIAAPLKDRRRENDAEHSWALALMACALAPEIDPDLDVGKVCMFSVVHDVVEVYAGDTSVWSHTEKLASKQKREADATRQIEKRFSAFPWIGQTIKEYESKKSPEAKYVYAMDKFINNLLVFVDENLHNLETHQLTRGKFDEFLITHRPKAHSHSGVAKYYDELIEAFHAHPEFFYQEKSNE